MLLHISTWTISHCGIGVCQFSYEAMLFDKIAWSRLCAPVLPAAFVRIRFVPGERKQSRRNESREWELGKKKHNNNNNNEIVKCAFAFDTSCFPFLLPTQSTIFQFFESLPSFAEVKTLLEIFLYICTYRTHWLCLSFSPIDFKIVTTLFPLPYPIRSHWYTIYDILVLLLKQ